MKKVLLITACVLSLAQSAFAQPSAATKSNGSAAAGCEAKAVDKNGKPLAGATKASFMKKCEADQKTAEASCDAKAVGQNGKPLAGAAKSAFMKKCVAETGK